MIVLNDFGRQWKIVESKVLAAVQRVGSSGRYILGPEVEEFEKALAEFSGIAYAVGVGNGMDALEIALRCQGLKAGEKVLTTSLSAFATTLAIVRAGGTPVFADIDATGNLDLAQCRLILENDRSIRWLLPVHLYGNPVDLGKLEHLKEEFNLSVVEDCAQAIGARHGGRAVGTVAQASALSFYPTKNLGALGDGGALLTNDARLAETAKSLRNYGQTGYYRHSEPGLNSRLDELHAAILRDAFLPFVKEWTERRRKIAHAYLSRIRNPAIQLLPVEAGSGAVWHLFPILVAERKREALRAHLRGSEILSGVHYPRIIADQDALKRVFNPTSVVDFPRARRFAHCELSLPIHPFLTNEEVAAVIRACNEWGPE